MNSPTLVLVTIIGNRILFNLRAEDAKSNPTNAIELTHMSANISSASAVLSRKRDDIL